MTMNFGNILGQISQGIGQQVQYNQQQQAFQAEQDSRQALAQERRASAALQQLAFGEKQRAAQTSQLIGNAIAQQQKEDSSLFDDAQRSATFYDQLSAQAAVGGNPTLATEFKALAQGKRQEAKQAAAELERRRGQAREDLANAAIDYQQNPTPEARANMTRLALNAGIKDVPSVMDPGFDNWVKSSQYAASDSQKRLEMKQKAEEAASRLQEQSRQHDDRMQASREARAQTAAIREQSLGMQREGLELKKLLGQSLIEARGAKGASGTKEDKKARETLERVNATSAQLEFQFKRLSESSILSNYSVASDLKGGKITDALVKMATTSMTPEQDQLYSANVAGIGLNLGRMLTAVEGGRQPTQTQVEKYDRALAKQPGETPFMAIYKQVAGMEETVIAMKESIKDKPDSEVKQGILERIKEMTPPISSIDMMKFASNSKNPQLMKDMAKAKSNIADATKGLTDYIKDGKSTAKEGEISDADLLKMYAPKKN